MALKPSEPQGLGTMKKSAAPALRHAGYYYEGNNACADALCVFGGKDQNRHIVPKRPHRILLSPACQVRATVHIDYIGPPE